MDETVIFLLNVTFPEVKIQRHVLKKFCSSKIQIAMNIIQSIATLRIYSQIKANSETISAFRI